MNEFKMGIVAAMAAASIILCLAIRHRAELAQRQRNESLGQHAEAMRQLSAENDRLSNLVVQVKSSQPLSREQLGELLRLRNEAGQLRQVAAEKSRLQADNAQLRAKAEQADRQLAEAQSAPNYWPKDKLAYAGYADPESALKSMLAAMSSGDVRGLRENLSPEALAGLEKELAQRGVVSQAQEDAEIKSMGNMMTSASTGFHILDQSMPSPDLAVIQLSFDGEGATRTFVLQRIDNQWKFQKLMLAGEGGSGGTRK